MIYNFKKTTNILNKPNLAKKIITLYAIYLLTTGVLVFIKPKKVSQEYKEKSSVSYFYSNDIGPDRGILIDDPLESGLARLKIIDSAEKTLDIAYFSIETGESPNLFFGALIDAADRGVEVNLLLDGMFHGLKREFKSIIYTFIAHPNMNLKFYEPFNPLMPWTINNRMHDKYIIADKKVAIIGGRNIGDKYFAPDGYDKNITNDRDIVIINTDTSDTTSVLFEMSSYFESIWNHKYSKSMDKKISDIKYKKGIRKGEELKEKAKLVKEMNKDLFNKQINLMSISFPTNKISFIHNPINRFSKEPWVWYEITQLMKSANTSIFAQSPYIIPNKQMINGFLDKGDFEDINITVLTNSLGSTPNLPAYSGYLNHRKKIIQSGINVYELQSKDSIHAKSFIIDNDIVAIGSFNLDPRSTHLSTESMVVIHSRDVVNKFEERLVDYIDVSLLVSQDYNYIPREEVNEISAGFVKRFIIKAFSYLTKWFEYLL